MAGSALDWVSVADAKRDLRLAASDTTDDDLIQSQIEEAVAWVQSHTGLPMIDRDNVQYSGRPASDDSPIQFYIPGFKSVVDMRVRTSVFATLGDAVDASGLRVDLAPGGRVTIYPPAGDGKWPDRTDVEAQEVHFRVDVGIDPADPPDGGDPALTYVSLRQAVKLLVASFYEGAMMMEPNAAVYALTGPFRDRYGQV